MVMCLMVSSLSWADENKPSIKTLDWMIGEWLYSDKSVSSDYTDVGSRKCQYTLMDQFIVCEMVGENNSGQKRNSLFYINFNNRNDRFEMIAMFNDFASKNLYTLEVSKEGTVIDMTNNEWTNDGLSVLANSQITYDGQSIWEWKIRTGKVDPLTGKKPIGYIDTATRIAKK